MPKTCLPKEGLLQVRAEIGHISNRHMGRTMAGNLSRLDIFPGETQEMEADHLARHLSERVKRVWEKFGCLIRTMYNADLLGHQNSIQAGTVFEGFRPEKGVVMKTIF